MYLGIAASAHLTARQYGEAFEISNRSLRLNRQHASSLRVKAVAALKLGKLQDAADTAAELKQLVPDFSVSRYREYSANANSRVGQEIADAFQELGLPK